MRIAFIFDALLYGGIERVGISYLRFLKKDGHNVDVYILNPMDVEGIINEIPESFSIYKIRVSPFLCPDRYWYIAKRWWWGKYILPLAYMIIYITLHIYGLRFRIHGKYDLAISMAGHLNDLSVNAFNLIRSEKKICWLHGALYEYMVISPGFDRLYMKIKNLVTLNNHGENTCLFFNKFMHLNIQKIYNPCFIKSAPIDFEKVSDLKNKYGDFILMIARMAPPKNPLGVIKAMEHVFEEYGKCYNLVFVGDGEMLETVRNYAKSTAIKDHVFFDGLQNNPQDYYYAAKIFAFSSYSEGMPTVLIEAMNFGLPIVTSDTSVREILRDGKDGLISAIDDNDSLGEDIYNLMNNNSLWHTYSRKSIERAQAFSPEVIKQQFNEYLSKIW